MRHLFQAQPDLQIVPIEKIQLPLKSRDELPPILAGLQWIWMHPTLKPEIFALLDEELLKAINARVAAAGREVFAKKGGAPLAALEIKVDSYVLETEVHFPTDLNLLWDSGRKCVDLIEKFRDQFGYELPGWRKAKDWRNRLKALERITSKTVYGGGANKETRVKTAVREYLSTGRELSVKVSASLLAMCDQAVESTHWEGLSYFHAMLDKHLDLVDRRLLKEETIPAAEKIFSIFEPHTEWIQKGKQRPNVELGHRLLVATDQNEWVQDYDVPVGGVDVKQSVPVADRLLGHYGEGQIASLSFDKGFTCAGDRDLLSLYVPRVVMPKRGKKNAAETERESEKKFVAFTSTTQRGGERYQRTGTSRTQPMFGRGVGGVSAVCGLRSVELQPPHYRTGIALPSKGSIRDATRCGLKPSASNRSGDFDAIGVVIDDTFRAMKPKSRVRCQKTIAKHRFRLFHRVPAPSKIGVSGQALNMSKLQGPPAGGLGRSRGDEEPGRAR